MWAFIATHSSGRLESQVRVAGQTREWVYWVAREHYRGGTELRDNLRSTSRIPRVEPDPLTIPVVPDEAWEMEDVVPHFV